METKEYIVILHSRTDLDDFYTDMEQQGHYEHVPNRAVELVHRRPASRSTHYQLTDEEVQKLKQDPRVLDIHQPFYDLGLEITPCDIQTSNYWSKGGPFTSGTPERNWGLLRCVEGRTRANWGSDGQRNVSATVNLPIRGRHVDIVIADGHIRPDHPEFAVNADGTGGSRVVKEVGGTGFNWFKYNPQVRGIAAGNYVYDFRQDSELAISNNNHGASAAAIAAGNTCGFAREANIYNINPYSTTINAEWIGGTYYLFDYIKEFHKNKPINPATGRKNPTIVNMSFGIPPSEGFMNDITQIRYKGVTYTRPAGGFPRGDFERVGISFSGGSSPQPLLAVRDTSTDNDVIDAMAEGVIFCGAAMNNSIYIDLPNGNHYDDAVIYDNGYIVNYMRGCSPGSVPGVICVGAVDATVEERKAGFSNKGPRVDIYAPSVNTIAARNTLDDNPGTVPINPGPGPVPPGYDSRNPSYFMGIFGGTSSACPHVAGIIACALESYPNMTPAQALSYIHTYDNHGVLKDIPFNTDYEANQWFSNLNWHTLFNGPNKYATYQPNNTRPNQLQPAIGYQLRPLTGAVYPRPRIKRTR